MKKRTVFFSVICLVLILTFVYIWSFVLDARSIGEGSGVLFYESFGVQGSVRDITLYDDGRLVRYCRGIPVCESNGTSTYQISVDDMAIITQNLAKVTTPVTSQSEPGALSESLFIVETNYNNQHLVHTSTNEALNAVRDVILKIINKATGNI